MLTNHRKLRLGGFQSLLGEFLGPLWPPGVPQGCPRAPRAEKVTISSFVPCSFFVSGASQNCFVLVFFLNFCGVFLWMCFGSGFRRPPGTMFRGFWSDFQDCFLCFLEDVGRGSVPRQTSFCIVFTLFLEHRPFRKKHEHNTNIHILGYVFWIAVGIIFS